MTRKRLSFLDAALAVLEAHGEPLHGDEITRRALDGGLLGTSGKTPGASMHSRLAVSIRDDDASPFVRTAPSTYGLRRWVDEGRIESYDLSGRAIVRVSRFPTYPVTCATLRALDGLSPSRISELRNALTEHRGTLQETTDWTKPDVWIPERLSGDLERTARAIWERSGKTINPRYMRGEWAVVTTYGLITDTDPIMLTSAGRDYLADPDGATVRRIDEAEGLVEILSLIADKGPVSARDLAEPWATFVDSTSTHRSERVVRGYLRRRITHLVLRGLVQSSGAKLSLTSAGFAYLRSIGGESAAEERELLDLIEEADRSTRESLGVFLSEMDPIAFEQLIGRLLREMGYTGVRVTQPSNDKGVDVVGDVQMGITNVREVIQVKRQQRNVSRPTLDALRGSLHRFDAFQGTIITIGGFTRDAIQAASERGVAPITLIDGARLVELLVEHGIGVRKRRIELLELDEAAFSPDDEDTEE